MLALEALTLALVGGGVTLLNRLFQQSDSHTPLFDVATRHFHIISSSDMPTHPNHNLNVKGVGVAQQRAAADAREIPAVTITLPEEVVPTKTIHDPAAHEWSFDIFAPAPEIAGQLAPLASQLVMGLVLVPLAIIYYTTFKPLHFALSYFVEVVHKEQTRSFFHVVSDYKYAMYFWHVIALLILLEPFVAHAFIYFHKAFDAVDEKVMTRLRRAEGRAHGQGILLKALGIAKAAHESALAALATSLQHQKVWQSRFGAVIVRYNGRILDLEERADGLSGAVIRHDEDIHNLAESVAVTSENQNALQQYISDNAEDLARLQGEVRHDVDHIIGSCNQEAQAVTFRLDALNLKFDALDRKILDQAEEIGALKSALDQAEQDKKAMLDFYQKEKFNNLNANEYYQKVLATAPPGEVMPLCIAYNTAMHMQLSAATEMMRRVAGGHPATPQPLHRSQHTGFGTPPPGQRSGFGTPPSGQYPGYGSLGGFPPNMRR